MEEKEEKEEYEMQTETEKSAEIWNNKVRTKGLLEHDYELTVEELRTYFRYAGGSWNRHADEDNQRLEFKDYAKRHYNYFTSLYPPSSLPGHKSYCICSAKIKQNCYLADKRNPYVLVVVGNCCIKRFVSENNAGRTCGRCEAPHVNRKYNLCNNCKPKAGWNKCEKCNECCRKPYKLCKPHLRLKILEERRLKQKIEMGQRRQNIATMSDTDTDMEEEIERKCACGKVLTGSYKKCYNCYNGIDPNATHPCETCEKPVKGTYKNCFLCNQKLRQEKG